MFDESREFSENLIHPVPDFLKKAEREAAELGVDPKDIANRYTMRLAL